MAFTPKTWTDRNAIHPGRRQLTPVNTGDYSLVDVTNADGGAYPGGEGYAWNAANMNDLEKRIAAYLNTTLRVASAHLHLQ